MNRMHLAITVMMLMMLSACGLKRQLELPEHDKFKQPTQTSDQPSVDPDSVPDSELGEDVVPVKPAKK